MLDGAVKLPKQLFGGSVVSAAVDPSDVSQPTKGGRDFLRLFKELRQSVMNDWGGMKPAVVDPRTRPFVELYAKDQKAFFNAFGLAIEKLSLVGVKTGRNGQIRHRCDFFN